MQLISVTLSLMGLERTPLDSKHQSNWTAEPLISVRLPSKGYGRTQK